MGGHADRGRGDGEFVGVEWPVPELHAQRRLRRDRGASRQQPGNHDDPEQHIGPRSRRRHHAGLVVAIPVLRRPGGGHRRHHGDNGQPAAGPGRCGVDLAVLGTGDVQRSRAGREWWLGGQLRGLRDRERSQHDRGHRRESRRSGGDADAGIAATHPVRVHRPGLRRARHEWQHDAGAARARLPERRRDRQHRADACERDRERVDNRRGDVQRSDRPDDRRDRGQLRRRRDREHGQYGSRAVGDGVRRDRHPHADLAAGGGHRLHASRHRRRRSRWQCGHRDRDCDVHHRGRRWVVHRRDLDRVDSSQPDVVRRPNRDHPGPGLHSQQLSWRDLLRVHPGRVRPGDQRLRYDRQRSAPA